MPHPLVTLFVLAMPIAMIAWTVTHEEIFREPREWCERRSREARTLLARKFFYVFTCEYCFSVWVTIAMLVVTRFRLLYDDWRGDVIAAASLVWIAGHYMGLYGRLRLGIRSERAEVAIKEELKERATGESSRTHGDSRVKRESLQRSTT